MHHRPPLPSVAENITLPVTRLTEGPAHSFFGYYDKSCWDASGRWILAGRSPFMHRPPQSDDLLQIGLIDTEDNNRWTPLAQTRAWNWQQGCMAQWLGNSEEIIFNDRDGDRFIARIINIQSRAERRLPHPVYAVSHSGKKAVSLSFARLHHQRPGYGYAGVTDPFEQIAQPEEDGLLAIDIPSGASERILSIAQAARFEPLPGFVGKIHRFNHAQFSHSDDRFAVLHRYRLADGDLGSTRLLTLNIDGSQIHNLSDHNLVSHYDWKGSEGILAWAARNPGGSHYYYFEDRPAGAIHAVGTETLDCDGHCSFSPDRQWVLTDTYPDKTDHHRTLLLYHPQSGRRINIGRFLSPPMLWEIRCDLHPRWSRDGRQICIDSIHEGHRHLYLLDVSPIVCR